MSEKTRPNGGDDDDDDDPEDKNWFLAKKGKRVNLSRWKRGKKPRKVKAKGISVNSGCWGRKMIGGCYVCLKEPKTLDDSPGESPTSDPNSSEFNFDMLRGLIEKNDFLSEECNPHV